MDVRLPGLSGIQTSRHIVAALPGTVVVLVSTHRACRPAAGVGRLRRGGVHAQGGRGRGRARGAGDVRVEPPVSMSSRHFRPPRPGFLIRSRRWEETGQRGNGLGLRAHAARGQAPRDPSAAGGAGRGGRTSARRHPLDHRCRAQRAPRGVPPGGVRRAARADRRGAGAAHPARPARWLATRRGSGTTTTTSCAGRAVPSPTSTAPSATTPCLTASDDQGFSIDEAEVTYWGVCPECVAAPATG